MEERSLGVLLLAIPYLGKGRVLKVFTPSSGLITLMAKGNSFASFSPFCIAEWVYKPGNREMGRLIDGTLLDPLLALRESYEAISAAGSMAKDLFLTQMPITSTEGIYDLFCSYLKKLPSFATPAILPASFRIKLLLREGLLTLRTQCSQCADLASLLAEGESLCQMHASHFAIAFEPNEWQALHQLAFSRQFSLLQATELTPGLNRKITELFTERTRV